MTTYLEKLKTKLAAREAKWKKKQWFVTDAPFRYLLTMYSNRQPITQDDAKTTMLGQYYYDNVNDKYIFSNTPIMGANTRLATPLTSDVEINYKSGGKVTVQGDIRGYVFIATNEDGTKTYYNTPSAQAINFYVPANTKTLTVTVYGFAYIDKDWNITINNDFKIILEDEEDIDVTQCIKNWNELALTQKRDQLSGVMIEESAAIEFVFEAKLLIDYLFAKDEFATNVGFKMMRRYKNNNNYFLKRYFKLDFSTYESDRLIAKVACAGLNIDDYVKARKSTKFTIPVSEVKGGVFEYKGVELLSSASWVLSTENKDQESNKFVTMVNPSGIESTCINAVAGVPDVAPDTTPNDYYNTVNSTGFHDSQKIMTINNAGKYRIKASFDIYAMIIGQSKPCVLTVRITGATSSSLSRYEFPLNTKGENNEYYTTVNLDDEFEVEKGAIVYLYLTYVTSVNTGSRQSYYYVMNFNEFTIQWVEKSPYSFGVNYIKPERLLNRLLSKVGGANRFKGVIEWEEDYQSALFAAESIRAIPDANVYTSMNDFITWMKCRGYVHSYSDDTMTFKKRDRYFDKTKEAIRLGVNELAKFEKKADADFAYTSVEIGYKKQDYNESINSRFEFNGTLSYTTGITATNERKLSIISPYRADSVGFELLCRKRGLDTTSTTSDNDLFEVALTSDYSELYQVLTATVEGIELFNAVLSPIHIAEVNKAVLGIGSRYIQFAGSDSNTNAVFSDGKKLTDNLIIQSKDALFKPIRYEFDAALMHLVPEGDDMNGVVLFSYHGVGYKGFVFQIESHYQRNQKNKWTLYAIE